MRHRILICLAAIAVVPIVPPVLADSWATLSRSTNVSPVRIDYSQLEGNRVYLNDDLGVALMRIPAKEAANVRFEHVLNAPYVYATYDPNNAAGSITVMKMVRLPTGDVVVAQRRFSPEDGNRFTNRYGMNPFEEFRGGASGSFVHVTQAAFNTAVGLAMQTYGSHNGYVASLSTRSHVWQTSRGSWARKTVTTHLAAYTKPVWTMVVPTGVGAGNPSGYTLPNGQTVFSGMTYIPQGTGTNMPTYEYMSYYHQESKKYWTGIANLIFAGIANAIAPGLGTALQQYATVSNIFATGGTWYLDQAVTGLFLSGKSDVNPVSDTSGWDWRGATYGVVQTDQMSQGGATGEGFRANRVSTDQALSAPTLGRTLDTPQDLSTDLSVGLQ